jgi:hypothetical protein
VSWSRPFDAPFGAVPGESGGSITDIVLSATIFQDIDYRLEATIQQEVESLGGGLYAVIEQNVYEEVVLSATVQNDITLISVTLDAVIQQVINEAYTLSSTLEQQVFDASALDGNATTWQVTATLDGADVKDKLTGQVTINAEENTSTIAEITLIPDSGPLADLGWIGQAVTIDYLHLVGGVEAWRRRLFTGEVIDQEYAPDHGTVMLTCSNNLQRRMENASRDAIDALIGGEWSEHVFDVGADNWTYALDRLSTVPASLHVTPDGGLSLTDWVAKETADLTITDSDRISQTLTLKRSSARDLIKCIRLTMDFRYQRLKQRDITGSFRWSRSFCEFLEAPFTLCQRSMVEAAANGTGWAVRKITYIPVPAAGTYHCRDTQGRPWPIVWGGGILPGGMSYEAQGMNLLCMGAFISLSKRWAQTVTEQYTVDVSAEAGDVDVDIELEFGLEAEQDVSSWELDKTYTTSKGGAVKLVNGDSGYDADTGERDGRAAFEHLFTCAVAVASTRIKSSFRRSRVGFTVPIYPWLDQTMTIGVDTARLQAKGKVYSYRHVLDIVSGSATSEVTLAISRSELPTVADSPVEMLSRPDVPSGDEYNKRIYLPYRIGGTINSPPDDPDWSGFMTNYGYDYSNTHPFSTDPDNPQTVYYATRFAIQTPTIEDSARNPIEAGNPPIPGDGEQQIPPEQLLVNVPQDTLTVSR